MKSLENSPFLGKADLAKIESKEGTPGVDAKMPYVFSLSVATRKTTEAEAAEMAKTGTAATTGVDAAEKAKPADLGAQLNSAASKLSGKPEEAKTPAEKTPAEEKKP
jgi:type IV pilus assembly protein PilN